MLGRLVVGLEHTVTPVSVSSCQKADEMSLARSCRVLLLCTCCEKSEELITSEAY